MRTDQLIDSLAADLKPVDRGRLSRVLFIAAGIGAAAAFAAVYLLFGPRDEIPSAGRLLKFSIPLLCILGIVATAAAFFLAPFARPGAEQRSFLSLGYLQFGAIVALAAVVLASSHRSIPDATVFHEQWQSCLFYLAFFAIVPFAAVIWALSTVAPTDLVRAGAAAGLVAGGLAMAACTLPCSNEPYLSELLWHGFAVGVYVCFGAMLGPRLLRW